MNKIYKNLIKAELNEKVFNVKNVHDTLHTVAQSTFILRGSETGPNTRINLLARPH